MVIQNGFLPIEFKIFSHSSRVKSFSVFRQILQVWQRELQSAVREKVKLTGNVLGQLTNLFNL
jgi:hypothetical protein